MKLLLIIFSFVITNLLLSATDNKNDTLTLMFHCKLTKPSKLDFDIASIAKNKDGKIYMLPFVNFASQYIYEFGTNTCKYENTVVYPDTARYCYINSSDTNTWKSILNSPLSCYTCTFSFRHITKDISNGNIFASAYTLKKISDTGFLPIPVLIRIDTTNFELHKIVDDTLWLTPLLEFGKKDNLLFCYGKKYLKDTTNQDYFITLFDLSQKKYVFKVSINELENKIGKTLVKSKSIPLLYFLDDSLGICYWYSFSPPIIFNFNTKRYDFFEYKGVFNDLVNTNFKCLTHNTPVLRKFMFHFFSLDNNLIMLGGKNLGEKIQDFELIELFLQLYDKTTFELKGEKIIQLPKDLGRIKFFSAFFEKQEKKIYFVFYTMDYEYYLFSLNL